MDNSKNSSWLFDVFFISLAVDEANIFQLVYPIPFPFPVPWIVAGVATYKIRAIRGVILWIVWSLAVLFPSMLSGGTNQSLWVCPGVITEPITFVLSRQLAAGLFGLTRTQGFLPPPPAHNAALFHIIIPLTGAFGLIDLHQWHRTAIAHGRAL